MVIDKLEEARIALLDQLPVPVSVSDHENLVILYANEEFARLIETDLDQIIGQSVRAVFPPKIIAKAEHLEPQPTQEGSESGQVTSYPKKDGSEIIIQVRKRDISFSDKECSLWTFNDISQFVLYEKELEEKHRELRRQQGELKELATIDSLTGTFNRRAFYDKAEEILSYADVGDLDVGVLMFDLDKFKNLNDTYGHAAGDEILIRFTKVVADCIRSSDIFARLGGEEFALLLPDTSEAATRSIAERIRKRVEMNAVMVDGEPVHYTTSVGGTMWDNGEQIIEKALSRSDKNLYAAKDGGRNQVCFTLRAEDDDQEIKVA